MFLTLLLLSSGSDGWLAQPVQQASCSSSLMYASWQAAERGRERELRSMQAKKDEEVVQSAKKNKKRQKEAQKRVATGSTAVGWVEDEKK